jgi:UrcA family protein
METMMTKFLMTLALSAIVATPALAQADDAATRRVSYADLDLSSPAGRAVLDRRLTSAVRAVCGSGSYDLSRMVAEKRCFKVAIGSARQQATLAALSRDSGIKVAAR